LRTQKSQSSTPEIFALEADVNGKHQKLTDNERGTHVV